MKRLGLVLCFVAVGCGGQALPGAKGTGSEPDLGNALEESAAEMERELLTLEGQKSGDKKPDSDQDGVMAGADAETPAAEPPPVAEGGAPSAPPAADAVATGTSEPEEVDEEARKRDGCRTACKALASMKRTEARICELVGESHEKCSWAHERVKEAVGRIERAACSCAETPR